MIPVLGDCWKREIFPFFSKKKELFMATATLLNTYEMNPFVTRKHYVLSDDKEYFWKSDIKRQTKYILVCGCTYKEPVTRVFPSNKDREFVSLIEMAIVSGVPWYGALRKLELDI